MRLLSWLSDGRTVGVNKPLLRTRLTLSSLDERVVPSGNPSDPPPGGPPQQGDPGTSPLNVGTDQTVLLGQLGSHTVYASNANGGDWFTLVNAGTGVATAILLEYDPAAVLVPANASTGYQPDATKPTLVWDNPTGTWTRLPAGSTNLPAGAPGLFDGTSNVYFTNTASTAAEAAAAGPNRRGGVTIGGWTIEPAGRGFIITDPLGNQYFFQRTDLPGAGGWRGAVWITPFWGGSGFPIQFPPPKPPTPEPPLAPPKKPPVVIASADDTQHGDATNM